MDPTPRFTLARRWRPWRAWPGYACLALGLAAWVFLGHEVLAPLGQALVRIQSVERA
jgi:hypothetical protein